MSPLSCDEDTKEIENTNWYKDDNKSYWQPVSRKSSFSDINQLALRDARNTSTTSGYVKEFRRYLRNEKMRIKTVERQRRYQNRIFMPFLSWIWCQTFERIRDDWLCLALLGIFMALLSVGVDKGIVLCSNGKFLESIWGNI